MTRKKIQEERWITAREATLMLKAQSGRDDIPDSYIRSLARQGKVQVKRAGVDGPDGRTNLYLASDIEGYEVKRRDRGKGDTVAARKAGSRRKATTEEKKEEVESAA